MAIAVHIVKSRLWRGINEEFENVYHYDKSPSLMQDADYDALIDALVTIERTIHVPGVSFKRALIHGPTELTKADDQMRFAKDLTGVGALNDTAKIPAEMTVVAQLYMGRSPSPHFRKTFLRKYWHVGALPNSTGEALLGNTSMASADITFFQDKFNSFKTVTANAVTHNLCKPNGQGIPVGTGAVVLPHLHTRQFRR